MKRSGTSRRLASRSCERPLKVGPIEHQIEHHADSVGVHGGCGGCEWTSRATGFGNMSEFDSCHVTRYTFT